MKVAAVDFGLQRGVDRALLLDAAFAAEAFVNHHGREMLTVIALNRDLCVGKSCADQVFDFLGIHCHWCLRVYF